MRKTPEGWPRISTALAYQEPAKAIAWVCKAFGFEVRLKVEGDDGAIHHSELVFGDGLIMIAGEDGKYPWRKSPRTTGGANTQSLMVYVDDVDAHCARARSAGAKIHAELKNTDYGEDYWEDRGYEAEDLEGHHWWFYQRIRDARQK